MVRKQYLYHGKHIFIAPYDKTGFRTFFRGTCNDRHPIKISELPPRYTADEAQQDLDTFAKRRMLKEV